MSTTQVFHELITASFPQYSTIFVDWADKIVLKRWFVPFDLQRDRICNLFIDCDG